MLSDRNIALVEDFPDATSVFGEVQIKGGVTIVVRADRPVSQLRVISNLDPRNPQTFSHDRSIDRDVFLRFPRAESILRKVHGIAHTNQTFRASMDSLVSARKPFGLGSDERGDSESHVGQTYVLHHKGGTGHILKNKIRAGLTLADSWKIFLPRLASGSDKFPHPIIGKPFIGEPGSVCSETYLAVGPFESRSMAENVLSYMHTQLFRYLCLLRKSSQDTPRAVFKFVPLQDFQRSWNDHQLRSVYQIDEEEWKEIGELVTTLS